MRQRDGSTGRRSHVYEVRVDLVHACIRRQRSGVRAVGAASGLLKGWLASSASNSQGQRASASSRSGSDRTLASSSASVRPRQRAREALVVVRSLAPPSGTRSTAGAALPAGPAVRAGQLDSRAGADVYLVFAPVCAVDPAGVLSVD